MKTIVAALMISLCSTVTAQQFSSVPGQGRSMVVTKLGIVAAPQFLASQAGAHILEQGGNAVDAAITTLPKRRYGCSANNRQRTAWAGVPFAIYYDAKTGKLYGLNSSGWTPKGLTIELFQIARCRSH